MAFGPRVRSQSRYFTMTLILPLVVVALCFVRSLALSEGECAAADDTCAVPLLHNPTVTLHNGVAMPLLQLGTAQLTIGSKPDPDAPPNFIGMQPDKNYRQMELALTKGMRAFDTALIYRAMPPMRHVLGEWWRTGKLTRKDVWVTSKVFHPDAAGICFGISHMTRMATMTPEEVEEMTQEHFEKALYELDFGYMDLMLLHWPSGWPAEGETPDVDMSRKRRIAAWKVLEKMYERGWARAIGVSNFSIDHLEQLKEDGAKIVPMVNQIEASVAVQFVELREYCKAAGIIPQAYSPMRGLTDTPQIVADLAEKYNKDIGQIAYRYLIQLGYAVVYLSNSEKRIATNTELFDFELTEEEMASITTLNAPISGWGLPAPHDLP